MRQPLQPDPRLKAHLKVAVVEHLYQWWRGDALFHQNLVQAPGGNLDPKTVRRIVQSYGVGRTVRRDQEKNFAAMLDERLRNWPIALTERAAFVLEAAETAEANGITKGVLLSAFSKVIWFAKPKGWTMYDSFAVRGLGAGGRNATERFNNFYARLNADGFDNTMEACRKALAANVFAYLWSERILDKYLMYRGHDPRQGLTVINTRDHNKLSTLWDNSHGEVFSNRIGTLVCQLAQAVHDQSLFQRHAPH